MSAHYQPNDHRQPSPLLPIPKSPRLLASPRHLRSNNGITHNTNRPRSDLQRPLHLQLPPVPRFHPANFNASSPTSNAGYQAQNLNSSAETFATGLEPSLSPGRQTSNHSSYQYALANAQKQLYHNHRELASLNCLTRTPSFRMSPRLPGSPILNPLGSPGPVTPLELEDESEKDDSSAGYFPGVFEQDVISNVAEKQGYAPAVVHNKSEPIEKAQKSQAQPQGCRLDDMHILRRNKEQLPSK